MYMAELPLAEAKSSPGQGQISSTLTLKADGHPKKTKHDIQLWPKWGWPSDKEFGTLCKSTPVAPEVQKH
jgi:hypothetical protein